MDSRNLREGGTKNTKNLSSDATVKRVGGRKERYWERESKIKGNKEGGKKGTQKKNAKSDRIQELRKEGKNRQRIQRQTCGLNTEL